MDWKKLKISIVRGAAPETIKIHIESEYWDGILRKKPVANIPTIWRPIISKLKLSLKRVLPENIITNSTNKHMSVRMHHNKILLLAYE